MAYTEHALPVTVVTFPALLNCAFVCVELLCLGSAPEDRLVCSSRWLRQTVEGKSPGF